MREIKFRVWHPKQEEMVFLELDDYLGCKGIIDTLEGCGEGVWMQSTGLKDRAGTEIFEGDIVKAASQGVHHIGLIKWGTVGFFIQIPPPQSIWNLVGPEESCEVIGNIHANPELIATESK